jgi:hypothetical protein
MDRLIGRMLRDYPDDVLVLCTALSQQPWVSTTKCTFRPRHFDTLLEFARVTVETAVKPVMAEQFHVECLDEEAATLAEARLQELTLDEEPLMAVKREGSSVFAGCRINDAALVDRPVTRRSDGSRQRFGDLFYMIHTMRSGRHHPDGVLWLRTGRHRVAREGVAAGRRAHRAGPLWGQPTPADARPRVQFVARPAAGVEVTVPT